MHLAALLALATAPLPAQDLATLLPGEAFAAVHLPSPRATLQLRGKNDFVSLALDERTLEALRQLLGGLESLEDGPDAEARAKDSARIVDEVVAFLGETDGLVAYLELPAPDGDGAYGPVGVLAVRGGDALAEPLLELIGVDAHPAEGARASRFTVGEAGPFEAYTRHGDLHVLATAASIEDAITRAERYIAVVDAGEASGPFTIDGVRAERAGAEDSPAVEFAVDLTLAWSQRAEPESTDPLERWFIEGAQSIRWIFGEARYGNGEEGSLRVVAPFDEGSAVDGALGFLRPVDLGALAVIPEEALQASAFGIDLDGLARWLVEEVTRRDEAAGQTLAGGIATVRETTGIDLIDGLLRPLADTMVAWEAAPAPIGEGDGAVDDFAPPMPRYGFGARLSDAEPYLELMDTLQGLAGPNTKVKTDSGPIPGTDSEIELWEADAGFFRMTVGVAEDALMMTMTGLETAKAWAAHLGEVDGKRRYVDDPLIADALKALGPVKGGMSVQRTDAFAGAVASSSEYFETLAARGVGANGFRRVGAAFEDLAAIASSYLDGITVTTFRVEGHQMVLHVQSR